MFEPIVNYDVVINKSEQSRQNVAERVANFLRGTGLGLSEKSVAKYFSTRIKEDVTNRTISEIYHRVKEDKWLNKGLEKNVGKTLKIILKGESGRTRITGKSKYKSEE